MNEDWVLEIRGGARMAVPAAVNQITSYVLLEQEDWFEPELEFVRRLLAPGERAVDIGANLGLFTVAMARAVGAEGRTWCYEPTPDVAARLQRSLAINDCANANLVQAAVSERSGTVSFAAGAQSELNAIAAEGAAGITVQAVSIDEASREWGEVDFLKMDVEGHEAKAIRGGRAFFAAAAPLVMVEINNGGVVTTGPLDQLSELGYHAYRLLPGPMILEPIDWSVTQDRFLLNAFACKPQRARALEARGLLATGNAPHPGKAAAAAWSSFARGSAYAGALSAGWRGSAGLFTGADSAAYYQGLASFAHSRDPTTAPQERHAWLLRALQCLAEALQRKDTLARRISYARVAAEAGWRNAAMECLGASLDRLEAEGNALLGEPFLAPSARFERLAPEPRPLDWLRCAVIETLERLRSFSSLFVNQTSLQLLAPVLGLPHCSMEMARRVQLVRLLHGLEGARDIAPRLRERTPENLNADFWETLA